ncbi:penicillin acylase family protein [Nitrospira sp. Nam80]
MKYTVRIALAMIAILAVAGLWGIMTLQASLPVLDGTASVEGLAAPVSITSDEYGVPTIVAESRADALRALGYVTARDRLFQMDLLRRSTAGELAEILGRAAVANDIKQRRLGLHQAARAIYDRLPIDQREAVEAYTQGINSFLAQAMALPPEFLLLGYAPQPWHQTDSLLVVLAMFQMLNLYEDDERMRTVMAKALPPSVVSFLLPDVDLYTHAVLHETDPDRFHVSIPVKELAAMRRPPGSDQSRYADVIREKPVVGSNGWVLAGGRAAGGRAMLANDMHLDMTIPNTWYRVRLHYEDVDMMGLVIPGIPVVVVGTNGHVAWGVTNVEGDFVDLVRLDLNRDDPNQYKTPYGWRRFEGRREVITVKGAPDEIVYCMDTVWGPVAEQPLLGHKVAVRWTGLDPDAVDIGLLHMDGARTVNDALDVMNRAKGPANNVLLADADGHIAWTFTGKIPVRRGFDGSVSVSWADGEKGWAGYVPAEDLPRIIDPPSGFIVSANQRMLVQYPYTVGHSFVGGYRAYRIAEQLRGMRQAQEPDLLRIQLDTKSEVYEFYRRIAREVLTDEAVRSNSGLAPLRRAVDAWDGHADIDSVGYDFLIQFRDVLARSIFMPLLERCRAEDRQFTYVGGMETPLRALLTARVPELSPTGQGADAWRSFLIDALERTWRDLQNHYGVSPENITWGRINRLQIQHPLSGALPGLSWLLDMPDSESPGCDSCVRVLSGRVSATERLVVSPGKVEDGILHMPGGQSGHPLSPHYRDQQQAWSQGTALPFIGLLPRHMLTLVPFSSLS